MVTLYHGDCLEIMPTLPAQSVDAILTDLPYGTTGVACVELGRDFIGCEMEAEYFQIAQKRMTHASKQLPLFPVSASETISGQSVNLEFAL